MCIACNNIYTPYPSFGYCCGPTFYPPTPMLFGGYVPYGYCSPQLLTSMAGFNLGLCLGNLIRGK